MTGPITRNSIARKLRWARFIPEMPESPDTHWRSSTGKCTVQIRYGGSVMIWYHKHPVHWAWDGRQFYDRPEAITAYIKQFDVTGIVAVSPEYTEQLRRFLSARGDQFWTYPATLDQRWFSNKPIDFPDDEA